MTERATTWTRYWKTGAETSCAGSYDGPYGRAIADFWREAFLALGPDARVLDIGTGNGPLPRILLGLESRQDLHCDAVDIAEVAPAWVSALPQAAQGRVRFHSGCSAEQLPFADARFDLVISQWGMEYSDLQRAVPEILRTGKPGGAMRFIWHHADALPVQLAEEEISHLQWLLQGSSLLAASRAMLAPMALAGSPEGRQQLAHSASANQIRQQFNDQQDLLQSRLSAGGCVDVLNDVRRVVADLFSLAATQGFAPADAAFDGLRQSLEDSLFQLRELRGCALDRDAAQALAQGLSSGRDYRLSELNDGDRLMGWAFQLNAA